MATESVATTPLAGHPVPELRGSIFQAKAELDMGLALLDLISDAEAEAPIQNAMLGAMIVLHRVQASLIDVERLAESVAKAVSP